MDEQRRSHDIPDDPVDHLDGMLGRTELEVPGAGAVRPGQLDAIAVQPDDEDLRLDGTVDIPANGLSSHQSAWLRRRALTRRPRPGRAPSPAATAAIASSDGSGAGGR